MRAILGRAYYSTLDYSEARVLIVDDTPQNIDLLMQFLEPEKYSLAFAKNGKQTLDIVHKFNPDLILLDDAFQSLYLSIDYNIVLHNNAINKNDLKIFPLGKLRQSLNQLSRANFIMQINRDYNTKTSVLSWDCKKTEFSSNIVSLALNKAFVFCGLANPKSFLASVKKLGLEILLEKSYIDHFEYKNNAKLKKDCYSAIKLGVVVFLTTYKDFVKLQNDSDFMDMPVRWFVLDVEYSLAVTKNVVDNMLSCVSFKK